jgi:hypothetical protein
MSPTLLEGHSALSLTTAALHTTINYFYAGAVAAAAAVVAVAVWASLCSQLLHHICSWLIFADEHLSRLLLHKLQEIAKLRLFGDIAYMAHTLYCKH